jgi:transposase
VAVLRHRRFYAEAEVNDAVRELLTALNQRPFRKRDGSRQSQFLQLDKPALKPLPGEAFELSDWAQARVNIDYHLTFDGSLYSVPYNLVHELVEIRSTATTIEILHQGARVASHLRSRTRGQVTTNHEHRPHSHQAHLEWTPSRILQWGEKAGPFTAKLLERILADKPHPEMGFRACLGIIRLTKQYSDVRMEAAAERALRTGACRYKSVASILKNSLDRLPLAPSDEPAAPSGHDNIRGSEYFE